MLWFRALAVAGLSLVLPGAGHAVLRDWVRALLFAGLFFATAAVFLPPDLVAPGASLGEVATAVAEETPTTTQFLLSFIALFCAIDAGFRAVGAAPGTGGDEPTCPSCGRELDADLTFCHWCTTRIDEFDPDEH